MDIRMDSTSKLRMAAYIVPNAGASGGKRETWLDTDLINVPMQSRLTIRGRTGIRRAFAPCAGGTRAGRSEDGATKAPSTRWPADCLSLFDALPTALTDAQTGMNEPIILQALTRDGKFYTLKMGATVPNSGDRYLRVSAAYEPPANDSTPAAAGTDKKDESNPAVDMKALNQKLAPWTFIVKSYRAEPLLKTAENLVKPREQPKESPAPEVHPCAG